MKRDSSISFIRVCAMFFIVICHIGSYFGKNAIGQFFNVGIQIFFMISGFLYGDKEIKRPGYWLYKRYIRLEIPALIWFLIIFISSWIRRLNLPELHEFIFLLLNLEGLNFIFYSMRDLFIGPWFFTNIMCCYILLLCYLRIETKLPGIEHIFDFGGIYMFGVFVILSLCNIGVSGALAFFIGFRLKRENYLEEYKKNNIIVVAITFVTAVVVRLVARHFFDGTLFYAGAIAQGTHVVIAASFIIGVKWFFGFAPGVMKAIADSRVVKHLDKISIYVYISHDMLFNGTVLSIFKWAIPLPLQYVSLIIIMVVFATVLWYVGELLTKQINKTVEYFLV